MAASESREDVRRGIERAEEARHSAPGTIRMISTPLRAALMSLHFDDADPVATCLVAVPSKAGEQCAWHAHGDSLNDAVLAWTKHLTAVHRDDWGVTMDTVPVRLPDDAEPGAVVELDRQPDGTMAAQVRIPAPAPEA